MTELDVKDGVKEYQLDSWKDCFDLATNLFARAPAYIYRGQANGKWRVRSRLDRHQERFPRRKDLSGGSQESFGCSPLSDEEHLNAFRRAIRGRRGPNAPALDDDDCWALGQHHGLATPLTDWTRSPFMALFFAFDEEYVVNGDAYVEPDQRALFALSTSVKYADIGHGGPLRFVSPPGDDNYRLISQRALLVYLPRCTDLESHVRKLFSGDTRTVLTKFTIPNADRHDCLVALNKMGINHMALFPDIDGAARYVNSLWKPGHEDSIAYL